MLNPEQNTPPLVETPAPHHIRHPRLLLVSVGILFAGYFATAATLHVGPFQPASTPLPSATPNPMASWQTYHNDQYSFEFKYPAHLTYNSGGNVGVIEELVFSNGMYVFIANDKSMAQGVRDCTDNGECMSFSPPCRTDGCQVYSHNALAGDWSKDVTYYKNGLIFEFSQHFDIENRYSDAKLDDGEIGTLISAGQINPINLNIFDQILSTLKFTAPTPQIDTPSSLTYRDNQYGFELTLPSTWKGYKVLKSIDTEGYVSIAFIVSTSDPHWTANDPLAGYFAPFNLDIYTKDLWAAIQKNGGGHNEAPNIPNLLGSNSKYEIGYSLPQDAPEDLYKTNFGVANGISPSTFKFKFFDPNY